MTSINAAAALSPYSPADEPDVFTMSNGALVVFLTPTGLSWEGYAVSTDSGATWTTKVLPNFPGTGDSHWLGMATANVYQQDGDVLHSFSSIVILPNSFNIHRAYTWDTSTNTLGGGSGGGYSTPISSTWLSTGMYAHGIAVDKAGSGLSGSSGGYWFEVAAITTPTLMVAAGTSDQSFSVPVPTIPANLSYYHTTIYDMHLRYVPGSTYTLLLTLTDDAKKALIVIPLVWNAGTGLWNNASYTPEVAYRFTGTDIQHTPVFDGSGNLDLIIRDGANLYAVKRTGTNSYTGAIPLYPSVNQSGAPAVSYDSGTGNALVAFRSTINQANGEIYTIKRTGGVWGQPALLAGGNADGYSDVLLARGPTGAVTPAVCKHGAGVDYIPIPLSGAPFTPTVSAPAGDITTNTPTLRAPYVNPSPTDPIGFQQWQVIRTSDSVSFWDSGQVATTVPFLLYAGTALVFGTQYQARVRYWDSISAGGAGSPSGWSAWQTFTPVHGPIATITSIVAGGATISSTPGTLVAPLMVVNFGYTQLSGDAANSYRLKLYGADAVTLLQASAAVPGTIASGSAVTTFPILLTMDNLTIYYLAVESTDAVTGIVADGPLWKLTTAWTPPTTPGSFSVITTSDVGTATGSFTVDGTAATINLYYRPTGTTTWNLAPLSGSLFTSFSAMPPPQTPYDYQVTAVSAAGVESAPAVQLGVIMGGRGTDEWSVIIRDLQDPTLVAWMGASDTWDDLAWTPTKDRDAYLPLFGRFQKSRWGVEDWETATLKFYLIGQYWLKSGAMSPLHQDALNLRQMFSNARQLQYLDPRGRVKLVEMTLFSDAPADDFNDHVQFTLEEMGATTPQFYIGTVPPPALGGVVGLGGGIGQPIG